MTEKLEENCFQNNADERGGVTGPSQNSSWRGALRAGHQMVWGQGQFRAVWADWATACFWDQWISAVTTLLELAGSVRRASG
jgi:hypothetical protein